MTPYAKNATSLISISLNSLKNNFMEREILVKIKKLREDRNIKPLVIANYLGIDESSYNRLENGVSQTWGKYLFKILEFFELSPSEFFKDLEGKNFINQEVNEMKDNAQNVGVIEVYNSNEVAAYVKLIEMYEKTISLYEEKIKRLEESNKD